MKLSEALNKFYILPLGQSEIVGFFGGEIDHITITWKDSDTFDEHFQEFEDQDIVIGGPVNGEFTVTTIEGENVAFIALDGVDLEHLR